MTTPTYPGVYIQELESGVHTITGVATSIAAFIGWAPQGPVNTPTLVLSWADFQRQFGGLYSEVYLGYAVNQFFGNGGQQAYIVRLVQGATLASGSDTTSGIQLWASSVGAWANNFKVMFLAGDPADPTHSFGMQILDGNGNLLESFMNVSTDPTAAQYAPTVIDSGSQYITFVDPSLTPPGPHQPTAVPTPGSSLTFTNQGSAGTVLTDPTQANFAGQLTAATVHPLLDSIPIVNIVCVPGLATVSPDGTASPAGVAAIDALQGFCRDARAFCIVDSPQNANVTDTNHAVANAGQNLQNSASSGAANSAMYFPWVSAPDPLAGGRLTLMPPSGLVAGAYAATDASRGVWKAPAGIDAGLSGIAGLQYMLTDTQNGNLNTVGVNCLRFFASYGNVVWGARTLVGADTVGSQWKYVPIRRFALFLESSLYDGTQWVVFEPNDETLWGQIRLNVGAFMQSLFLKGAFQGTTPQQAYFVKCDAENNPQSAINQGIVTIEVGFAPLYPAEFVIIQIQQMMAGLA
jgi:phage tail sheath protein FI